MPIERAVKEAFQRNAGKLDSSATGGDSSGWQTHRRCFAGRSLGKRCVGRPARVELASRPDCPLQWQVGRSHTLTHSRCGTNLRIGREGGLVFEKRLLSTNAFALNGDFNRRGCDSARGLLGSRELILLIFN